MRFCLLMALLMLGPPAVAESIDFEGMAEDVALQVAASQECNQPPVQYVAEVGEILMKIDEKAFLRGFQRGVMLFKGVMTEGRVKACAGYTVARAKAELNFQEAYKALKSDPRAAGR